MLNIIGYKFDDNHSITIDLFKDELYIKGDIYKVAQYLLQDYINSEIFFKSYYFFSISKNGKNKIKINLGKNQNKQAKQLCFILKKYAKNILFL